MYAIILNCNLRDTFVSYGHNTTYEHIEGAVSDIYSLK